MSAHRARKAPSLPSLATAGDPPANRFRTGALGALMKDDRPDLDDSRPNGARTARVIHGFRVRDQIRRMFSEPGSGISEEHVVACDKLRELFDLVRLGRSPGQPFLYSQSDYRPRSGPSPPQIARAAADVTLKRALKPFTDQQRALLAAIVFDGTSLRAWVQERSAATGVRVDPAVTKGVLICCLDQLVEHFAPIIARELDRGSRLSV